MGTERGSSFIGEKNNLSDCNNVQRTASVERTTHETSVKIDVNIDGSGQTNVSTGLSFIDHLITSLGKHSMLDIELKAISKDGIMHHLIEDVSVALSTAIDKALSGRLQITRFGYALVPMDDCLSYAAIDLVKRQFHNIQLKLTRDTIEEIPKEDLEHFVLSLAQNLNACTHVVVQYGDNDHHKVESAIKAFAVAMRMAVSVDKKRVGTPSTKGAM
jgi:imidazoleglycerol-phosphate dehydratase